MDGWNTTLLLGRPIIRGYVSFREGTSWGECYFFFQCLLHGNFCHPGSSCSKNAWCGRRVEWHQLPKKSAWNGFSQPIVFVHEIGARIKICWLSFMWFHARTTKSWSSPFLYFWQAGEVHLLGTNLLSVEPTAINLLHACSPNLKMPTPPNPKDWGTLFKAAHVQDSWRP